MWIRRKKLVGWLMIAPAACLTLYLAGLFVHALCTDERLRFAIAVAFGPVIAVYLAIRGVVMLEDA